MRFISIHLLLLEGEQLNVFPTMNCYGFIELKMTENERKRKQIKKKTEFEQY